MVEARKRWLDPIRDQLEAVEAALHRTASRTIGIRVVDKLGWTRILRLFVAGYWLLAFLIGGTILRPDLLHPTDLGSDSSNYVAAAERVAAGHDIYALRPGDRPVPLDYAPEWTVPILSPPTVPTAWLPMAALPDGLRLYPVWAIGMAGTVAAGFLVAAFAPLLVLVLAIQFMPGLSITSWSGNVNALIAAAIVAIWWGIGSGRPWPMRLAGGLAAVATGLKLGPVMIAFWVFVRWRARATAALVGTGAAFLAVTITIAGIDAWPRYLEIVRASAIVPNRLSVPGLLVEAGVPADVATTVGLPIVLAVAAILIVVLRTRPLGYLVAVLGSVFATSVVRFETLAIWIVAGTAWWGRGLLLRPSAASNSTATKRSSSAAVRLSISAGVLIAVIVVARSFTTGGLERSSFSVDNRLDRPMVVRLSVNFQSASFGFVVPAGGSISGWQDLVAGSPPLTTVWTIDCRLIGRVPLDRTGGRLVLDPGGLRIDDTVRPGGSAGSPPLAPFAADCAEELRDQGPPPSTRAGPGEP